MSKIIVCGYMIRHPVAGNILAYFHYILGLHRLGHKVFYLEESGWSQSCYDPVSCVYGDDPGTGLHIIKKLMNDYGISIPVCYINRDTGTIIGCNWDDIKRILGTADLLLNLGGVCWLPEFRLCRHRVYIDMDPFFTQVGLFGSECLSEHHAHFSYGINIGHSDCKIPNDGIDWYPTLPPVVTEIWETKNLASEHENTFDKPFTTIANWSSYGTMIWLGKHYGQKDEEFLRLLNLPRYTKQKLELSLSGVKDNIREQLQSAGWLVTEAGQVSKDMTTYIAYIKKYSRGELSVAKNAYVKTRSGWFSDRSVCYLAAGRPVILQDTGFREYLPHGKGLLAFSSQDEALECINKINTNYIHHCQSARMIAEDTFSYKTVLSKILETIPEKNLSFNSNLKDERKP